MRIIDLAAVPNQSFSVTLDGNRWDFVIKQAVNVMCCDLYLNDQEILRGVRIVAGTPIIPYKYLSQEGNFIILVENESLPDWQLFGVSQVLVYASIEEINAIPAESIPLGAIGDYRLNPMIINSLSIVLGA